MGHAAVRTFGVIASGFRPSGEVGTWDDTEGTTTGAVNVRGADGVVADAGEEAAPGSGGGGGGAPADEVGDERTIGNGSDGAARGSDGAGRGTDEATGAIGTAGATTVFSLSSSGTAVIAFARACI
jgi:hypothetical protein